MPPHASTWLAILQEQALGHRLAHIDLLLDTTGLRYPLWQSLADLKNEPGIALLLDGTPNRTSPSRVLCCCVCNGPIRNIGSGCRRSSTH